MLPGGTGNSPFWISDSIWLDFDPSPIVDLTIVMKHR
uniref:Uncharacterized protein n=1 Tax=Nymphaea colorata TaxID=210225 RepID=A0A5K0Y6L7_9MAGN